MKYIKKSLVNCSKCIFKNDPGILFETNAKYFEDVDIIFVSDFPSEIEIKNEQLLCDLKFRKYFDLYIKDKLNYLIISTALCLKIDNDIDSNEISNACNYCKNNVFNIIEMCKPKLIMLMGAITIDIFNIINTTNTELRGKIHKWNNYDCLVTIHPKYHNDDNYASLTTNDLRLALKICKGEEIKIEKNIESNNIFYYKVPEKYYTEEYRLVDIQYIKKTNEVLYIFRNKLNQKEYYKTDDTYVCYQPKLNVDNRKLVDYSNLTQVKIPYNKKYDLASEITYEGDIKIIDKHSQDFYIQKQNEAKTDLNVLYLDIEIFMTTQEFPRPEEAKFPISMITYAYNTKDNIKTLVIDNRVLLKRLDIPRINETPNIVVFKNEIDMLKAFYNDISKIDPDYIAGWNVINFDLQYIINRSKNLGVPPENLSPFGEIHLNPEYNYAEIIGRIAVDQDYLYKSFTFTKEENYKLGTIAQKVLGETKIELEESMNVIYEKDINKFIEYNIRDVTLLVDLEFQLNHIKLQNEIMKVCKTSSKSVQTTMGQLDSLVISYLKENKMLASINADMSKKDTEFPGAYVHEPITGVHDYDVDFDFTSLYPSLILTYNIGINTFVMKFKDPTLGYDWCYNFDKMPDKFEMIIDPTYSATEIVMTKKELLNKVKNENLISTIWGTFFLPHEKELSIYAEILVMLMNKRKEYKKMMLESKESGNSDLTSLYNIRQLVYKVLANALYGVLGNQFFRFFNLDLAASVTSSGQEAIKTCIIEGNNFVEKLKTGKHNKPGVLTKQQMYCKELNQTGVKTPFVITGDTDSLFITYKELVNKKDSEDEILNKINKWNDEVQNYLNLDVLHPMIKRHNVLVKNNALYLKNELIIKRGLFLAKKRYAIYVIAQEGKKIDELVSMGLETKRSDFSKYTKECLNELLDLILKSDKVSIKNITQYIKSKEDEFIQRIMKGDKSISRPCSFTKKLEEYKVIPQGVRAMQAWNELMYDTFIHGTKGYLYKIKGLDYETAPKEVIEKYDKYFLKNGKKLEVIALPDEENKLPIWFIPDMKPMLDFAWVDRYNLMLEPLLKVNTNILTF